jgi:hypothetical protein
MTLHMSLRVENMTATILYLNRNMHCYLCICV